MSPQPPLFRGLFLPPGRRNQTLRHKADPACTGLVSLSACASANPEFSRGSGGLPPAFKEIKALRLISIPAGSSYLLVASVIAIDLLVG